MFPSSNSARFITLTEGNTLLQVVPEIGGAISRFCTSLRAECVEWFRPMIPGLPESPTAKNMGCFPLVPYANILRNGRIPLGNEVVQLPLNRPGAIHSWHGDGWQAPWSILSRSKNTLDIEFVNDGQVHSLLYRAKQSFRLTSNELSHRISIENIGDVEFPAGLGLHPYFAVDRTTTLTANLRQVWIVDEEFLPLERIPTPEEWSFASARHLQGMNLKNCFCDWDGHATIAWNDGQRALAIRATPGMQFLTIWTPPGDGFCCIEPLSHSVDAFNLGHRGVPNVGYKLLRRNELMSECVTYSWQMSDTSADRASHVRTM